MPNMQISKQTSMVDLLSVSEEHKRRHELQTPLLSHFLHARQNTQYNMAGERRVPAGILCMYSIDFTIDPIISEEAYQLRSRLPMMYDQSLTRMA